MQNHVRPGGTPTCVVVTFGVQVGLLNVSNLAREDDGHNNTVDCDDLAENDAVGARSATGGERQ